MFKVDKKIVDYQSFIFRLLLCGRLKLFKFPSPGLESQFLQYGHGEIDQFGIGYNYKSLMHYGRTAFTKAADLNTMEAIGDADMELGNTDMTQDDILELNALYDCKSMLTEMMDSGA